MTEKIHAFEARIRIGYCEYLSLVEVLIYILLGTLLAMAAILGVVGAFSLVADAVRNWTGTEAIFELIDRLLLVLMLLDLRRKKIAPTSTVITSASTLNSIIEA